MKRLNEICRWGTLITSAVGVTTFILGGYCGGWYTHSEMMVAMLSLTAGICIPLAILFWAGYMQTTEKHELTYAPALIIAASFGVGFAFMIVKLLTPMAEQMFDATGIACLATFALGLMLLGIYFIVYAFKAKAGFWHTVQAICVAIFFASFALAVSGGVGIIPVNVDLCCGITCGSFLLGIFTVFMQSKWVKGKLVM